MVVSVNGLRLSNPNSDHQLSNLFYVILKNIARNVMEGGFKRGTSKFKPTLLNRKVS